MRQLISDFPLPIYSVISTLIFVGFFMGIIYWTFGVETKESMDERAKIPFQDETDSNSGVQK